MLCSNEHPDLFLWYLSLELRALLCPIRLPSLFPSSLCSHRCWKCCRSSAVGAPSRQGGCSPCTVGCDGNKGAKGNLKIAVDSGRVCTKRVFMREFLHGGFGVLWCLGFFLCVCGPKAAAVWRSFKEKLRSPKRWRKDLLLGYIYIFYYFLN